MEWLALWSNAELRRDFTPESQFTLSVLNSDHETVLIYVRYIPTVNRQAMNMAIDNARDVIMITARGYGWDRWLKIKERVEMEKSGSH